MRRIHRIPLIVEAKIGPSIRDLRRWRTAGMLDFLQDERGFFAPIGFGGQGRAEGCGTLTSSPFSTTVTANATPGSDGAWTQIDAATGFAYHSVWVYIGYGGTAGGMCLIDFAIGASGSEKILIADIPHTQGGANGRSQVCSFWLPLYVPSGVRVAARVHRSDTASTNPKVALIGFSHPVLGIPSFHRATTYGTVLASARGVSVDPGGTLNTQGTKTEIVASTTNRIRALYPMVRRASSAATSTLASNTIQHWVGGSGSEKVITPEYVTWTWNDTADIENGGGFMGPVLVDIPAGSRLTAAARSNNNTAGVRESQVSYLALD